MKPRILLALIILALSTLACSLFRVVDEADGPESTPAPKALFSDDFSNPRSGWDQAEDENGVSGYVDGEYRLFPPHSYQYRWANPGKEFEDVSIEVDLRPLEHKEGDMGVICRYQDEENFYFLRITSAGRFGISKMVGGEETLLSAGDPEEMDANPAIQIGVATNHLRADCIGEQLSLYANGQLLAQVQDDNLSSGDVGLLSGTFDQAGNDVRFDNFVVYQPVTAGEN